MPFTEHDAWLFKEGSHYELYNHLGAKIGDGGCHFSVWAPHAESVRVKNVALKRQNSSSGIWEGFVAGIKKGDTYSYHIVANKGAYEVDKGDPFAYRWDHKRSVVWDLDYSWQDSEWLDRRQKKNLSKAPMAVYEIHHASWKRKNKKALSYLELAKVLPEYLINMGFTHVEFLPVMEHPFYGSWGYQTLGYFAPSSRYGTAQDFMQLIDTLHQHNIGVILDWVPSHFPTDPEGLSFFDGTHLFEPSNETLRMQPDWDTCIFDFSHPQVQSFLISSACFWLEKYHVDALRVDAVTSMLYLNFSKKKGQWSPNRYGGHENLGAIDFLRKLNNEINKRFPYAQTIAEESTAWTGVTKPSHIGGLGFSMKWNMGWMHDTLEYMSLDPIFRKFQHNKLLFSIQYTFTENYILPLSHDEVVYEKKSLLNKMPENKYANLRLLLGYMYMHPGKKLLFMGDEFGQISEWNHEKELEWQLLEKPAHKALQKYVQDLNHFYTSHEALYEQDFSVDGFRWVDTSDWEGSIISFLRKSANKYLLVVCNFTPVTRYQYKVGVPRAGAWKEVLNSDSIFYAGSNVGNAGLVMAAADHIHNMPYSVSLTLPPLSIVVFE